MERICPQLPSLVRSLSTAEQAHLRLTLLWPVLLQAYAGDKVGRARCIPAAGCRRPAVGTCSEDQVSLRLAVIEGLRSKDWVMARRETSLLSSTCTARERTHWSRLVDHR
ncbi:hypothetical protein NDU88_009501 [Pleurodeles waltl]|uniref:Uncharacterized protein n=1 Tax=Pleurodeles waltl TaxID=8319 RepID=A0AAV7PTF4_PLEWA|nr:hypothetical protein NDU88_009501 [Pleurodeles waltl]